MRLTRKPASPSAEKCVRVGIYGHFRSLRNQRNLHDQFHTLLRNFRKSVPGALGQNGHRKMPRNRGPMSGSEIETQRGKEGIATSQRQDRVELLLSQTESGTPQRQDQFGQPLPQQLATMTLEPRTKPKPRILRLKVQDLPTRAPSTRHHDVRNLVGGTAKRWLAEEVNSLAPGDWGSPTSEPSRSAPPSVPPTRAF